jgi:exosortase
MENVPSLYRNRYIPFILLAAGLVATFFPTFVWLSIRFLEEDSYYSHGFLIPLIVAALIWRKREVLKTLTASSSLIGLMILLIGLAMHLAGGMLLNIGFVSAVALLMAIFGLSLYIFGTAITRAILAPLLFFIFMIPLPKVFLIAITFKMKMMAAHLAVLLLTSLKLMVSRAGSIVYLPNGILTVESECSGISSLISLLTLSVLFAYVIEGRWYKKLPLVAASFPIAIIANVLRISFLILAAYIYGVEAVAHGFLHYGAGITLWLAALAMFWMLWKLLEWKTSE